MWDRLDFLTLITSIVDVGFSANRSSLLSRESLLRQPASQ
jgi:hypothetical protein